MDFYDAAREVGLPRRFADYVLLRCIASGGMGQVYHALLTGPGGFTRDVAIKRVLVERSEDAMFATMLLDEARIAARLRHGNIAQVIGCGEHEGTYYIVLECVEGPSLRSLLRRLSKMQERLSTAEAVAIAVRMLRALHVAHEHKSDEGDQMPVIHRDVSPENILVSYEGEAKLIDFGIAKAKGRLHKTQTGSVRGKLSYMSPEQIRADALGPATDQFSMGLVLQEMLTGVGAYERTTETETIKAVFTANLNPLDREQVPGLPDEVRAVIRRALSVEVEGRFPSCLAFAEALGVAYGIGALAEAEHALVQRVHRMYSDEANALRSDVMRLKRDALGLLPTESGRQRVGNPTREPAPDKLGAPPKNSAALTVPARPAGMNMAPPVDDRSGDAATPVAGGEAVVPRRGLKWPAMAATIVLLSSVGGVMAWQQLRGSNAAPEAALASGAPSRSGSGVGSAGQTASVAGADATAIATGGGKGGATQVQSPEATPEPEVGASEASASKQSERGKQAEASMRAPSSTRRHSESSSRAKTTRRPRKESPPTKPDPTAGGEMASLTVICLPWCQISIDGTRLSSPSPLRKHSISSGKHTVEVINPPSGNTDSRTIDLAPGATETVVFRLVR